MIKIGLELAAFFAVLLVFWLFLKYMLEKYAQSKFVDNYHNGVLITVKRKDYIEVKNKKKESKFVMVPQSFVFFSDKTPEWIDKSLMLGDTELYQHLIGNEISEHAEDLFIPYISREVMSLEKQKDFFCQYGVAEARNYLQDDDGIFAFIIKWRKLASWYHREIKFQYAGSITFALYLIIIISLLTAGVSWRMEEDYNRKWTFVGNTSVDNPAVMTRTETFPMPVASDELDTTLSEDTLISDPIYMGGNLISVQVESKKGYVTHGVRANANLNLKKGDTVTVRRGMIMNATGAYGFEAWVITPAEAKALVDSGKFHYHQ